MADVSSSPFTVEDELVGGRLSRTWPASLKVSSPGTFLHHLFFISFHGGRPQIYKLKANRTYICPSILINASGGLEIYVNVQVISTYMSEHSQTSFDIYGLYIKIK